MTDTVYIPTRGRWDRLDKIADAWLFWGFKVIFCTELDQEDEATKWREKYLGSDNYYTNTVTIGYLAERPGNGIGWVRQRILEHAERSGRDAFVMSDDDCYPLNNTVHPRALLEAVKNYPVLACAASHSQQNHFLGGLLDSHPNDVVLAANGICFQLFAINVARGMEVGFDTTLKVYEDAEFMRGGITRGWPWALHTGVRMVKTGRSGDPGGIQDYIDLESREGSGGVVDQTRILLADRWGDDIVARPPKRPRQSWAKFYDRHMPDWRKYSAGHGGSLKEMTNKEGL